MMNRLSIIAIATGVLSLSAIFSFQPSEQYLSLVSGGAGNGPTLHYTPVDPVWKERARKRRRRTRVPSFPNNVTRYKLLTPEEPLENDWKEETPTHVCGSNAIEAAERHPYYFPKNLGINSKSRVVITNVLSSLGMHLALLLSQQCGVEMILGVDAMLPNTRRDRMPLLERYALLKRRIRGFQKLQIPFTGVMPKAGALNQMNTFGATHIVHLVPTYLGEENPMYPVRDKEIALEQLLEFVRTKNAHLVYAGPNLHVEKVLASSYHALYNVKSIGLELPRTYGPWGDPGSWTWTVAEGIVRTNATLEIVDIPNDDDPFLYVEDAATAILAAMQLSKGTTSIKLTADTTKASLESALSYVVKSKEVAPLKTNQTRHFEEIIRWMPTTRSLTGIRQLFSWHYTHAHPYGRVHRKLPSYATDNYHYPFPCVSECSIRGSCRSSVYDSVVPVTRRITKGCKFVIYMVDLAANVTTLPAAIAKPTNETLVSLLCQVAFVSGSSTIANSSGWSTVKVPSDASKMAESDYILPKLSPGLFFDRSVSKAVYVKPSAVKLPDGDSMVPLIRSIDAPARRGKNKRIQRPKTPIVKYEWVPETPARHVMLFGHEDPGVNTSLPLANRVKYLVERDGLIMSNKMLLQLRFYEHVNHLIQNGERRRASAIRGSYYKGFPFHFLQTTMVVHDLREEESRLLRCEWYDEHVFWGVRDMEDLSLAFVLGRRRVEGRHGLVGLEVDPDWTPLQKPFEDDSYWGGERLSTSRGMELFVRVLAEPLDVLLQKGADAEAARVAAEEETGSGSDVE